MLWRVLRLFCCFLVGLGHASLAGIHRSEAGLFSWHPLGGMQFERVYYWWRSPRSLDWDDVCRSPPLQSIWEGKVLWDCNASNFQLMHLFIVSVWTRGFLFIQIVMGYNPWLPHILMLTLSLIWPVEPLQAGFCVILTCPHHFLSTSLFSATDVLRLTLFFPSFSPGISRFSKEPNSSEWRIVFKSQDLGTRVPLFPGPINGWS